MRNYNEQQLYDLPLQTKPFFLNHPPHKILEDRPKQLQQDQYRMQSSGKENRIKQPLDSAHKQSKGQEESCFRTPEEKGETRVAELEKAKKNENLRNIIRKQLYSHEKGVGQKLNCLQIQEKTKGDGMVNRYQQLLSQVYGEPKLNKNKSHKKVSNARQTDSRPGSHMKRHDSYKALTRQPPKPSPLLRYKSESTLSPFPPPSLAPSSCKYSSKPKMREPSYLQLYLQKRKPFLFL